MAVLTWTDQVNGASLLTMREAYNAFNTSAKTQVNLNTTDIATVDAKTGVNAADIVLLEGRATVNEADIVLLEGRATVNEADIVDHEARIAAFEDTGMTVMSGNAIAPQSIAITPTKVNAFDSVAIDVGVGTSADATLDRMTADLDGVFKLRFEGFVSYASNVTIVWQIYKNGSPFGNSITLSGQGANSFPIVLISSAELLATDYLELFATASAVSNLTVSQSNGTLEKTHF